MKSKKTHKTYDDLAYEEALQTLKHIVINDRDIKWGWKALISTTAFQVLRSHIKDDKIHDICDEIADKAIKKIF